MYKELIKALRDHDRSDVDELMNKAADAIYELLKKYVRSEIDATNLTGECLELENKVEQLKRERDAAISDLKSICDDTGDGCGLCKHLPCVKDGVGYCIGWQWRGVKEGAEDG